jgi:hypothetical protein
MVVFDEVKLLVYLVHLIPYPYTYVLHIHKQDLYARHSSLSLRSSGLLQERNLENLTHFINRSFVVSHERASTFNCIVFLL